MALSFQFPPGTDMSGFTDDKENYTPETESLIFNMWFCGVGQFKTQNHKDLFYRRYIMLSVSQGAPEPFLSQEFIDSVPVGLSTNGGTLTDAAFRKKLIHNLEHYADNKVRMSSNG